MTSFTARVMGSRRRGDTRSGVLVHPHSAPPGRSLQCRGPTSWDPQAQGLSGRSEGLRHSLHPAPVWLLRTSGPNIPAAWHPPLVLTWVLLFQAGRGRPQALNPQAGKAGLAPAGDWAPWGWCHIQRPQGPLGCPVPGAARSRTGCTQDTDRRTWTDGGNCAVSTQPPPYI